MHLRMFHLLIFDCEKTMTIIGDVLSGGIFKTRRNPLVSKLDQSRWPSLKKTWIIMDIVGKTCNEFYYSLTSVSLDSNNNLFELWYKTVAYFQIKIDHKEQFTKHINWDIHDWLIWWDVGLGLAVCQKTGFNIVKEDVWMWTFNF